MLRVLKRESSITFHIYFYSTLLCKKFIARYYSFIARYYVRNSTCACDWTRYKPIKLGRTDSNQNSWFCFMQLKTSIWFVFLLFGREQYKHIIGDVACFNERIFGCVPDLSQGLIFNQGVWALSVNYAAFFGSHTEISDWCCILVTNCPRFIAKENSDLLSFFTYIDLARSFSVVNLLLCDRVELVGCGLQLFFRWAVLLGINNCGWAIRYSFRVYAFFC